MPSSQDIIDAARACLGTPWHHQGRVVGPQGGLDCIGLLAHVADAIGQPYTDRTDYPRHPVGRSILEGLDPCLSRREGLEPVPGDVAVFWMGHADHPQHGGIIANLGGHLSVIHAYYTAGKVVEHVLDAPWQHRLHALYDWPILDRKV